MQVIAGFLWCLASACASMGPLQKCPQLETGEHTIPGDRIQTACRMPVVMCDEFIEARETIPGFDIAHHGRMFISPSGHDPAKVDQGIANRGQLPIDKGDELGTVRGKHRVCP